MRIEGMTFGYASNDALFKAFDFSCDARVVVFTGRSGCGKTTLLKLIGGLLVPSLSKTFDVPDRSRMVLQDDALFPWLSVRENFELVDPASRRDTVWPDLLNDFVDRPVYELSFGQRRLAELYRAIRQPPGLLCFDEPFNFIDPEGRKRMARALREVTDRSSTRLLLTTHHQEDADHFDAPVFRFPESGPIHELTKER